MSKRNAIAEAASKNPSVVLRAFAPETEYVCTLDAWIFLEAIGSPFATAGKPGLRDMLIAALVFTDVDAVIKARRNGKFDAMVAEASAGKMPSDVMPLTDLLGAAIAAGFAPVSDVSNDEKKSSAESDGGSV